MNSQNDLIITPEFIEMLMAKMESYQAPAAPAPRASASLKFVTAFGTVYSMEHLSPTQRRFSNAGAVYDMSVSVERIGKLANVVGLTNGEIAYSQSWLIDVKGAMYHSFDGYLPNEDAAISGAFDCMMSKLPK